MAKITLDTITSSYAATSLFQSNFTAIEDELNDKVLYRDNPTGEANQMENDLDMNSNDILNAATVNSDIIILGGTQITPSGTTTLPADQLTYDNTTSGLTATDVQAAIDENDANIDAHLADTVDAHDATAISYDNTSSSLTATEVQAAIDEVEARVDTSDAQLATGNNHGKNLIINGDFSVWQRGTGPFTTGVYTADRWLLSTSGGTASLSQATHTLGQTDVPNNPSYYMDLDITTGADFCGINYRGEGVATTAGETVTLSFWARGTNPGGGSFAVRSRQYFGTGGSPSTTVNVEEDETLVLTSSWQKYTTTFTYGSITGKTMGTNNDDSYQILITQGSDTSTDAWNIDISNVQLEFGDTATEFEYVSPADQLARCQRYFERLLFDSGSEIFTTMQAISTTAAFGSFKFSIKRAIPTVTFDNPTNWKLTNATGAQQSVLTVGGSGTSLTNREIQLTVASGLVAGNAVLAWPGTGEAIDIDAEL